MTEMKMEDMATHSLQANAGGSMFVFLPKEMVKELGLEKGSSIIIHLNKTEKRIELYHADSVSVQTRETTSE